MLMVFTGFSEHKEGAILRKRVVLLAPLLALFAFVATAEAADVAPPVEGEAMDVRPTGTSVVSGTTYSGGQALKLSNSTAVATETVSFASSGDVVLMARAGQRGGSPTLAVSVNGTFAAPAQAITNSGAPEPYTFDVNAPSGSVSIGVKASNTGLGRYPFLDVLSFPASGGGVSADTDGDGVPDADDNCPNVTNAAQGDLDKDGVGNQCDPAPDDPTVPGGGSEPTPTTDTDRDGVPDD